MIQYFLEKCQLESGELEGASHVTTKEINTVVGT